MAICFPGRQFAYGDVVKSVERISLLAGLRDLLVIRSSSGSELALHTVGGLGRGCKRLHWMRQRHVLDVKRKRPVGEPFGSLLRYPGGTASRICVAVG
jgi:hypothetical protein